MSSEDLLSSGNYDTHKNGPETIEVYTAIDGILEEIGIDQFEMNITPELVDGYLTTLEKHEAKNTELQWFNNFHQKLQENTLMKTMWKEYGDKPSEQAYNADELLRKFLSKLYKTSDYIQSLNPWSLEKFLTIEKDQRDTDTKYRKILTFLYLNALKEGYPRSKPNEEESSKFSYTTSLIQ